MAEMNEQARDLIARLRTPRVTHHQVSGDWEPYETVAKKHALDPIRVEAADMIERLLAHASGVSGTLPAFDSPSGWKRRALAAEAALRAHDVGGTDGR